MRINCNKMPQAAKNANRFANDLQIPYVEPLNANCPDPDHQPASAAINVMAKTEKMKALSQCRGVLICP